MHCNKCITHGGTTIFEVPRSPCARLVKDLSDRARNSGLALYITTWERGGEALPAVAQGTAFLVAGSRFCRFLIAALARASMTPIMGAHRFGAAAARAEQ